MEARIRTVAARTAYMIAGSTPPRRGRLVQALDHHRLAHAAGHAHRLDAVAAAGGLQAVDERGHDARPGHPERMAEGDRAAERVELVVGDAELLLAGHDLRGERLVDLDDVDLVNRLA